MKNKQVANGKKCVIYIKSKSGCIDPKVVVMNFVLRLLICVLTGFSSLTVFSQSGGEVVCNERNTSPSVPGYIILQLVCDEGSACVSVNDFIRDGCDGNRLIQYYCNPNSPELYSSRSVMCPSACNYRSGTGYCS